MHGMPAQVLPNLVHPSHAQALKYQLSDGQKGSHLQALSTKLMHLAPDD